jgi:hypothetical protein
MRAHLKHAAIALILVSLACSSQAQADNKDDALSRVELGVALSGIQLPGTSSLGVAGCAVFNINSVLSLEVEGNFFLKDSAPNFHSGGRAVEGLFGAKAGYRTDRVGVFGKVRPGLISFSNVIQGINFNPANPLAFSFQTGRLTQPALDVGAVIEVYPAKHWAWRSDLGDTIIFYDSLTLFGIRTPGTRRNNFQFSTGLQYRF